MPLYDDPELDALLERRAWPGAPHVPHKENNMLPTPKFDVAGLLKRPEVTTLIVAVLVAAAAAAGLPTRAGLDVPESALGQIVTIFLAIFVAAVFEGKYKGVVYAGGIGQLLRSTKFRLGVVTLIGMLLNAALLPFGYGLPEDTLAALGNFVLAAIVGIGGVDGVQAARGR